MDKTLFQHRHIENSRVSVQDMLKELGVSSVEELVESTIPATIRSKEKKFQLPPALLEHEALEEIKSLGSQNKVYKSFIGQGYHSAIMPSVIQRNVLENPGWYTSYTAYQSEISQGRLEALFNFQTLTSELTGLPISNASLLDEGTAVAEAVMLSNRFYRGKKNSVFVLDTLHPQSLEILSTRTNALDIQIDLHTEESFCSTTDCSNVSAIVLQLPSTQGSVYDIKKITDHAHANDMLVIAAIDPLFLVLAGSPADWGVDIALGSFQRYGIPLGFGGPHAAYFSTTEQLKRLVPGRIVGKSKDSMEREGYRFALQTREQHIRREKATSNICTSQALLAVLSSMYAVYHGPKGLRNIALQILQYTQSLYTGLKNKGLAVQNDMFFDTVSWNAGSEADKIQEKMKESHYNIRRIGTEIVSISFDECTSLKDYQNICSILGIDAQLLADDSQLLEKSIPRSMLRSSTLLSQKVFHEHHTETEMMRYIRKLMDKDLALDKTMIPLGSCTMKLNAASELIPLSWEAFGNIHPFAPLDQSKGYQLMMMQLEEYLCQATGYDRVSLQPNAGSQGEYAGLLAICAYHKSKGESQRNVCFIPSSAHGTNPASAQMANLDVVIIKCSADGNVDLEDLRQKAEKYSERLAAIMITYPSTHGVFEEGVKEICSIVHGHGGQVYVDGANLNALVGLVSLPELGADVSHLNLHKTFSIPHGGGGPGVGPIGVREHLVPFLPYNLMTAANVKLDSASIIDKKDRVGSVSASPWGSALVCIVSWMYIRMMGSEGLVQASSRAIVHANYIANRLRNHYQILYTGQNGRVAHECIIDINEFKQVGLGAVDIAKRLIDYGFHSPTMSWPVVDTLMIEPTESESKYEMDRFCEAMINIRLEADLIQSGEWSKEDNPLVHAPHTAIDTCEDKWEHAYSRKMAAYPYLEWKKRNKGKYPSVIADLPYIQGKYWAPVSRIDNSYGDTHLICTCPPMDEYQNE